MAEHRLRESGKCNLSTKNFVFLGHTGGFGTSERCVRIWLVRLLSKTRLVCGHLSPLGLRNF